MKVAVLAITKNGIRTGRRLLGEYPGWELFAPARLSDGGEADWFEGPASSKVGELFKSRDALVCIFSLGAVIRLVAPHLVDKSTDPAVLAIDDAENFVISTLSGHAGGANRMAEEVAAKLGATPVVTTAADVNKTIAVDMVGRDLGWEIEDSSQVTRVSGCMVNGEPVGVYQDAGSRNWWGSAMPPNVTVYDSIGELASAGPAAALIISDRILDTLEMPSVVYRPKSLVVGVGLHGDTDKNTVRRGLEECLGRFSLSPRSVARLASLKRQPDPEGLGEYAREAGIPLEYVDRDKLAEIDVPNPSEIVAAYEGTASVSEAAAILVSKGTLVVEKQKFPPGLTVAVARIE
ncbi:precorrin-3B C17-methyltransferase [Cenarchaeum symbiosum A]|uniref:Precorrin-3B C17-methyltransferase n=1 Tax=Cenarchaeum symbiosum (strain A) TaxID=414004 RepID=A0RYY2_CENSY|nr:precorrin-3B C17-methyltransferase [Cenarchaeum symbiosum A]